jgi:prepilin-type N-terminal cleavage/methylation domain-containing protein
MKKKEAFTLIELLVVVAIIGVLVGLLLPALGNSRANARRVVCLAQLHQIYLGCVSYASMHNDRFPDKYTTGGSYTGNGWGFRRRPGLKDPNDPRSLPETYGLIAVLETNKCFPAENKAWICPAQADWMKEYGNTYTHSVAGNLAKYAYYDENWSIYGEDASWWIWDNYNNYPYLSGFRVGGAVTGYTIDKDEKMSYPHPYNTANGRVNKEIGEAVSEITKKLWALNILTIQEGRAVTRHDLRVGK